MTFRRTISICITVMAFLVVQSLPARRLKASQMMPALRMYCRNDSAREIPDNVRPNRAWASIYRMGSRDHLNVIEGVRSPLTLVLLVR